MLKLRQLPLAVAIAAASSQLNAAGFAVNEHSTNGLGRANAGEAAIAEDASILSHNPAGLTRLDQPTLTGSIAYVDASVDVTGNSGIAPLDDAYTSKDVAPAQVVPAAYFALPINDRLTYGVGLYSDFGFKTDYDKDFAGINDADVSDIVTVYLTNSLGFKVNDQLSLGAGVSIVKAHAELSSSVPTAVPFVGGKSAMDLEGDDTSYGWNIGALYEFNDNTRIGISYKSEVDLEFDGEISSELYNGQAHPIFNPSGLDWNTDGGADLTLPAMLEIAAYHAFNDQFAIHGSITRTYWSSFDELAISIDNGQTPPPVVDESWNDVMRYAVGATYKLNQDVTLRAGYAKDQTPTDNEHRTLRLPDGDRNLYSVGASWDVSDNFVVDAAYQYLDGQQSNILEKGHSYKTATSANLFSVGGSYKF
ncbi:long-chain fatty acid transport protein [Sinobacterium caligoides]|uniref:Long-chain fatty acid transport protein n=1 Tax=Sinobacterium caligoides TaxID=933926 RepID=A0A3N2DYI5_9GAMM|nr:porin [Sinobacterium caligoides]ROS04732.1 long-chain fatty acid transport protein [Sinobacterium caligoides]